MTSLLPIALSCGEPAGVGPEITVKAWQILRDTCPFFWIGDPRHLPGGTDYVEISTPADALKVCATALPVMTLPFDGPAIAGQPLAQHAAAVIQSIKTAVRLVQTEQACALWCNMTLNLRLVRSNFLTPTVEWLVLFHYLESFG